MKVKIVDDSLIIEIPLQTPKDSKSKKTQIIASSSGATEVSYKGKTVYLGINAYVKK
jgi:hypothetical protein